MSTATFSKPKRKYLAVMLLCFLYGGFLLFLFLSQAYTFFWHTEVAGIQTSYPVIQIRDANGDVNRDFNVTVSGPRREEFRENFDNPLVLFTSPQSLLQLIGGVISIFAGIAIWGLVREKEIKMVKEQTSDNLLLPDEKKVIQALRTANYEMTQSRLVSQTGLSKVQVHRIVKKLEAKGAIEKHGYGLTNKIILKKELFE